MNHFTGKTRLRKEYPNLIYLHYLFNILDNCFAENCPGAVGFPSATYVNGLPRYRHNRREILPESPIANATKLVLEALEYRARIVAVSVGPLAVVTIFTYLERFLILDIFEQRSDRDGVFLKSCHEQSTSVFVFAMGILVKSHACCAYILAVRSHMSHLENPQLRGNFQQNSYRVY